MSDVEAEVPMEGPPAVDPSGSSMMAALRARYAEIGESKTTDIDLPGYDGLLVARYRVLDVAHEINAIGRLVQRQYKGDAERVLYSTLDIMAKACIGIFTRRDGELWPLSASISPDEPPICYDDRLADFMGMNGVTSAREVILGLFQGIETMVMSHGQVLSIWMTDTTREVTTEFAGG
jgi:hypothetical protein